MMDTTQGYTQYLFDAIKRQYCYFMQFDSLFNIFSIVGECRIIESNKIYGS